MTGSPIAQRPALRSFALFALLGLGAAGLAQAASPPLSQRDSHFSQLPGLDDTLGARAGLEAGIAVTPAAVAATRSNAAAIFQHLDGPPRGSANWAALGPTVGNVAGPATYTGQPTTISGRVTGIAVSPACVAGRCPMLVATAGGGVWRTADAYAVPVVWQSANSGLPTLSLGSIAFDPTDGSGRTVYVGTGEINGSSDSEAGLGLYRSDDLGSSWELVAGSAAVATDRAIGAIAIDPVDPGHILIGTGVARHGMAGVYGGRFTPPNAAPVGLYESHDGGASFSLAFAQPSDVVVPNTSNGTDFFRGGVSHIEAYRNTVDRRVATQFYFSMLSYGIYRSTPSGYEQVLASQAGGSAAVSSFARTEFALAPMGNRLRIYAADTDGGGTASLYRVDNANVPANVLTGASGVDGWKLLSDPTSGNPGFGSYSFCNTQCSYDMFVASPPGRPDTVWIGGQMQYDDIFRAVTLSNGRAVMRSTNAGQVFTDMTNDHSDPLAPLGMHPDQHAIAFLPGRSDVAVIGSDGGLIRNDGVYVDTSAYCGPAPANVDPGLVRAYRNLSGSDLANCLRWLKATPKTLYSLNAGIPSLQFQGIAFDPTNPRGTLLGGTQDNGSWVFDGSNWTETIGGDGGQAGINSLGTYVHTYTGAQGDVQFGSAADPFAWDYWYLSSAESGSAAFYSPLIADGRNPGTWFVGALHVWRTTDDFGGQAYMDLHCNEFFGDFLAPCGDFEPLGGPDGAGQTGDLTGAAYGTDKAGGWVSRVVQAESRARGAAPTSPLWAGTRRGRVFVALNANAGNAADVVFTRIDGAGQPNRFVSAIAVDPKNPLHAYVSFTGYDAYTPATPGHIFDVNFNPKTGTASWRNITGNLGDQPILSLAYDPDTGRLFAGTDYGVAVRTPGGDGWQLSARGMATGVTVYDLSIDSYSRTLYAATHGRGIYRLDL